MFPTNSFKFDYAKNNDNIAKCTFYIGRKILILTATLTTIPSLLLKYYTSFNIDCDVFRISTCTQYVKADGSTQLRQRIEKEKIYTSAQSFSSIILDVEF